MRAVKWIDAVVRVLVLNLVPLWGFAHESWSAGTTLALYWIQTLVAIPFTAGLIVLHRRMTRKAGHYNGTKVTRDARGGQRVSSTTYLSGFLWTSTPLAIAHGVFLAALLGLVWNDGQAAIDLEDLRMGTFAALNLLALSFAMDLLGLRHRPFAWLEFRAGTVLQRTLVVHLVLVLGVGVAALTGGGSTAFFYMFLVLKLLMDVLSELPRWDATDPPAWVTRLMNRIGGAGSDFAADWKRMSVEEAAKAEAAERPLETI